METFDLGLNTTEPRAGPATRDYFAEMYVAGILADRGWDIYFPRRDRGFDMIISRPYGETTIIRPVQVKGKYATDEKTDKARYGFVGNLTAFHDDMVLAIPYFVSQSSKAPVCIAWMQRANISPHSRGFRCEPAIFKDGMPYPRPTFSTWFDDAGASKLELPVESRII